nr:adenylate cyclase type 10-like isoform X2 [Vespula vulgaris]
MPKVINCAFNVKNAVMAIEENAEFKLKMNIVISAGNVIFSILGNELSRHYVIAGQPLLDFKKAQDISLPGDLILSTKAWEYCTPSKYEYVIKDAHNIKVC